MTRSSTWPSKIVWIAGIVFAVLGGIGVAQRLMHGHEATGYGSYVPWGLWIGLYFLAVGISGGAFVIGAAGYLFGVPGLNSNRRLRLTIVLSAASLIAAFSGVIFDLGRMERLHNVLLTPSFTSMMAFNAWMYNIFLIVILTAWALSFRSESLLLKPLLVLGIFLSVLFPSQSGVFFEAVRTNPYWHNPILSVLFLASAIALGGAGILLLFGVIGPESDSQKGFADHERGLTYVRNIVLGGITAYLIFEFAEISIAFWNPGSHDQSLEFLMFGPYWYVFWIFNIGIGSLLSFLLLISRSTSAWILSSIFVIFGFTAARMGILIPGQVIGQLPGLEKAFQDVRLTYSYSATTMEYLVGFFMAALALFILWIGIRLSDAFAKNDVRGAA